MIVMAVIVTKRRKYVVYGRMWSLFVNILTRDEDSNIIFPDFSLLVVLY